MGALNTDISELVAASQAGLMASTPVAISYQDMVTLGNNRLPESLGITPINVYALWIRQSPDQSWVPMYVGQRSSKMGWNRVREHLFSTPRGTQSKLAMVRAAVATGFQLGVTSILVQPDSMRLAVEEELINRNSTLPTDLPWNKRARSASVQKRRMAVRPVTEL